ncbi:MAG: 5-keto-4-deoxy-D-glucarate aldolase [Lentisphaerae bacterium ADurb.Bin242]|nr:MAG: 5-keto-4-deoxy-D-glucarate aldolase [Lentisphaerae bacterium ADurb.Bin242]
MNINNLEKFKRKALSGTPAAGIVITFNDPAVSELAADAGFDFTWIDMEHSPITLTELPNHILALRGTDCAPFVRIPWNEFGIIKTVSDLAPAGVIVPQVNSESELLEVVSACRYPPEGTRGCGPRRAVNYGAKSREQYFRESQEEPFIIAQIEHVDAVRNLDKILKVKHLGSICIGPYDLSGSMGKFASPDDPEVGKVIDEICKKAHKAGVMVGAFAENPERWAHRRLHWAAVTTDAGALFAACREKIKKFDLQSETEKLKKRRIP